jgi:carotenoid 1,2-hydratase
MKSASLTTAAEASQCASRQPCDPHLNIQVAPRGYAWWYVDALSDDGRHGLTLIAFIGSVFSPYYFNGRRRGLIDPNDYCSLNVCLYGSQRRWTMTERRSESVHQHPAALRIGPSNLLWSDDNCLTVNIKEVGMPIPRLVRGTVRLRPDCINPHHFDLHENGRHHWWPFAPSARVEVNLEHPALSWTGHAYFDRNWGEEPIEDGFVSWDWSRARMGEESAILYNMNRRHAAPLSLALRFARDGTLDHFEAPPNHRLPATPIWRVARSSQSDSGHPPRVAKTLEDTPFYSRSVIDTHLLGRPTTAVHESLSLERFRSPVVQHMLRFRMPRKWR